MHAGVTAKSTKGTRTFVSPVPVFLVVSEFPFKPPMVRETDDSMPADFAVHVLTIVDISVLELIHTPAAWQTRDVGSRVLLSVCCLAYALAMLHAILPVACVLAPGRIFVRSKPCSQDGEGKR